VAICPTCGQENPEGFRFCGACGADLAAVPEPARETRKTITVLFCDVTGSTALGEKLDPESLRRVMARYFETARACLERHGGTVEKFIGDAVMGVFGVPAVHEDDALRALRAAVELRDSISALNEEFERDYGVSVQVRVGVNTGEVVTGTEERLATGDAVNVAARLEQAAPPGEILIGEETLALARDAVEVEPLEPLVAKGKSEPVRAFRLVTVRKDAPAFERRLDSAMVGRVRELALLRRAFERAVSESGCHLFTMLGPAGVGKSRLVAELLGSLGGEVAVLSGRCLSYGEGITYWPLIEIFRQADAEDELTDALAQPSPEETFWSVRTWLERRARERPLVLVLDDLHWAEPTFLDLVEHVADWSRDAPILLLCIARAELLDARPAWSGGKLNATTVLLEPLSEPESEELVTNLVGQVPLDERTRRRIVDAAEGNPLFVEEMLAMVAEDDGGGEPVEVPPTIQALLAARLDRLQPRERQVVERASVEGKVFHRGAVAELTPEEARPEVATHLLSLIRKELIRPDEGDMPGEDAFRFRHLLIRDAAYQSLPKEERASLHERFASWLERVAADRGQEYEEILGYHLEQAHRLRAALGPVDASGRELGRRAAGYLSAAGRRALDRSDMFAATNLLDRAASLLERTDPARVTLLPDLGHTLVKTGDLVRARSILDEAVELGRESGDARSEHRARVELLVLRVQSEPDFPVTEFVAGVDDAIHVLGELNDDAGVAHALYARGVAYLMAARYDLMEEPLERGLVHARRAGDRRTQGEILFWLMALRAFGSTPVRAAIERCQRVLAETPANLHVEESAMNFLGLLHAMQGRFDEARRCRSRSMELAREFGDRLHLAATVMVDGWIELLAGQPERAEQALRPGAEALIEMGETAYLSTIAAELAQALYKQARYDEAETWTMTSEQASSPEDAASELTWRATRGLILARRGDFEAGETLVRKAVEIGRGTDDPRSLADCLLDLAEVLELAGRSEEAIPLAEEALGLYERKGILPSIEQAKARLARLGAS
jgi:class 3 adenylate cyclase/tetratricopeptide (TPR) repeat protein